jgi:hypothetical protein
MTSVEEKNGVLMIPTWNFLFPGEEGWRIVFDGGSIWVENIESDRGVQIPLKFAKQIFEKGIELVDALEKRVADKENE